jgi:hypothetical protein
MKTEWWLEGMVLTELQEIELDRLIDIADAALGLNEEPL